MRYRLTVTEEAELDLAQACAWYDEQAGLGKKFLAEVGQQMTRIALTPMIYAVVAHDIRRAVVRRFPYSIYYTVQGECVDVLAVWHGRRDQARFAGSTPHPK